MRVMRPLHGLVPTVGLALLGAQAQTYVTPRLGGGQVAADMVHIDVYYDADANQMHAQVDETYGLPELRPLEAGQAFDPQAAFAVLTGKAYNAQYGWNAGGFFSIPAGAAIWIELLDRSPGLEVYEGWGRTGAYTPIHGTAGSPPGWAWSGVMTHNTCAVADPTADRYFAEYHLYFGGATTGSREGFLDLDDARVRLEWTAVPVPEPFRFGAIGSQTNAPLAFVNADHFTLPGGWVMNLRSTNTSLPPGWFESRVPMVALPATSGNGGPAENHAVLGACLELETESLRGPPGGSLSVWAGDEDTPRFTMAADGAAHTNRLRISQNRAQAGTDPYGRIPQVRFTVDRPGLYTLGFRVADGSANGAGGSPLHAPSQVYSVHLQAGVTVAWTERDGPSLTAVFGGEPGRAYHLERTPALDPASPWQPVAGPLPGTNRLQRLTDPDASGRGGFYRLRAAPD